MTEIWMIRLTQVDNPYLYRDGWRAGMYLAHRPSEGFGASFDAVNLICADFWTSEKSARESWDDHPIGEVRVEFVKFKEKT